MKKPFTATIGIWNRKRRDVSGNLVEHRRYTVNYRDPDTGQRKRETFERKRDAEVHLAELTAKVADGTYVDRTSVPTIREVMKHWLESREGQVKPSTLMGYRVVVKAIVGPMLQGSMRERCEFTKSGEKPHREAKLLLMLGDIKANELTTAEIRKWVRLIEEEIGHYTSRRALSFLKAALALCEEDYGIRAPSMPTNLGRRKSAPKKTILMPDLIGKVLVHAQNDRERGIYYAFPFLTGTRTSEQLGLLWDAVDFEANVIRISRIQERDGSLSECTKTEAGARDIPMAPLLREMLLAWRLICPRLEGKLHRVFPAPGRLQPWPKPRLGGGGPLVYQNFRRRFWEPVFAELELPYVTLHSARHSFISTMQAQGVEVGLVAKLAGHANPNVTLGHYTQAVRGGEDAVAALARAYGA